MYYLLGATLCNIAICSKSVSKLPSCYEVLVPVVFLITFKLCPIYLIISINPAFDNSD